MTSIEIKGFSRYIPDNETLTGPDVLHGRTFYMLFNNSRSDTIKKFGPYTFEWSGKSTGDVTSPVEWKLSVPNQISSYEQFSLAWSGKNGYSLHVEDVKDEPQNEESDSDEGASPTGPTIESLMEAGFTPFNLSTVARVSDVDNSEIYYCRSEGVFGPFRITAHKLRPGVYKYDVSSTDEVAQELDRVLRLNDEAKVRQYVSDALYDLSKYNALNFLINRPSVRVNDSLQRTFEMVPGDVYSLIHPKTGHEFEAILTNDNVLYAVTPVVCDYGEFIVIPEEREVDQESTNMAHGESVKEPEKESESEPQTEPTDQSSKPLLG